MTTSRENEQASPVERAAELWRDGPSAGIAVRRTDRLRVLLRGAVLRAVRPYAHHQRELDRQLVDGLEGHAMLIAELDSHLRARDQRMERLEAYVTDLTAALEAVRKGLQTSTDDVNRLRDGAHALPYMEGEPFGYCDDPLIGRALGFSEGLDHVGPGGSYVAFEDIFRGSAERVAAGQQVYLKLLRDHAPVLDVGCGRGEFLGLLAAAGIEATGIDGDPDMVAACRERGVETAELATANEHLRGLRDESLGSIFCAQVIEHMPYEALLEFLELSLRRLRPGGVIVIETVNPHRPSSLKTFWTDPTHQHPLFPEVTVALCGIAGFKAAHAFAPSGSDFEADRFEAEAYAVLARKS